MKFHVISKKDGHYTAEAETLAALASEGFENDPFMVVAAGSVAEGEDYQAIQVKPDTVLVNSKPGHRYITADSIAKAFGAPEEEPYDDDDPTKITVEFASEYGNIPNSIILDAPGSVELPTIDNFEDEDFTYTFNGWKNGEKNVSSPLNVKKDTKLTAKWTKAEKPFVSETYNFTSYSADKTTQYATGTAKTLEKPADGKQKIQVLTNEPEREDNPFIGKVLYINTTPDSEGFYQLYDENKEEIAVLVKIGG